MCKTITYRKPINIKPEYKRPRTDSDREKLVENLLQDSLSYAISLIEPDNPLYKKKLKQARKKFIQNHLWELTDATIRDLFISSMINDVCTPAIACQNTGIKYEHHLHWLDNSAKYKSQLEVVAKIHNDIAEYYLLNDGLKGKSSSLQFYLNAKGQDRGYGEQTGNLNKFEEYEKIIFEE